MAYQGSPTITSLPDELLSLVLAQLDHPNDRLVAGWARWLALGLQADLWGALSRK